MLGSGSLLGQQLYLTSPATPMGRIYFSFPGVLGLAMGLDMNKECGSHNVQVASLVLKRLVLLALVAHLRLPQKRRVLGSLLVPD